jgi:hypothetical protein
MAQQADVEIEITTDQSKDVEIQTDSTSNSGGEGGDKSVTQTEAKTISADDILALQKELQEAKAEATIEVARLENGYYAPHKYEDGHVDPDHTEGSRAHRWDEDEGQEGGEQPASDGHWTNRV